LHSDCDTYCRACSSDDWAGHDHGGDQQPEGTTIKGAVMETMGMISATWQAAGEGLRHSVYFPYHPRLHR
jgi:hypothetical protein